MQFSKIYLILPFVMGFLCASAQDEVLPSELASLNLWFKSDTGVVHTDGKIEEWQEISGNMNHAVITNLIERPTFIDIVPELDGFPAVRFDGVNDFLTFSEVNDFRTIVFLVKHATGSQDFPSILGHSVLNDFASGGSNTNSADKLFQANTSSNITDGVGRLNGLDMAPLDLPKPTQYSVISLVTTGNVVAERITRDRTVASRVWNGDFVEIIGFNEALSDEDLVGVENYLMNRYAPPLVLQDDIESESFCPISLEVGDHFLSYDWSTGSDSSSAEILGSGTYTLEVTDVFGRTYIDSFLVSFPGEFIESFSLCSGEDSVWSVALDPSAFSFDWNDMTSDSDIFIDVPGSYQVNVTDTVGCMFASDTVFVDQDEFSQVATLGNDTSLCVGNSLSVQNIVNGPLVYSWNDNSMQSTLMVSDAGAYWVTAVNQSGCVLQDTVDIAIAGQAPTADFFSSNACESDLVSFSDLSVPPAGATIDNYLWDFGDSISSTLSQPTHVYADTGSYSVSLIIQTNEGCSDNINLELQVHPKPEAVASVGLGCTGSPTVFADSSTVSSGIITSSIWTFDEGIIGSGLLTDYIYTETGQYDIELVTFSNENCRDTTSLTIEVFMSPVSDFLWEPVCLGEPMLFEVNPDTTGAGVAIAYLWDFGNQGSIFPQTSYQFNSPGFNPVSLLTTTETGCSHDTIIDVSVHEDPIAQISAGPACEGQAVSFSDNSIISFGDTIANWQWILDSQGQSSLQNPNLIFDGSGDFDISLNVVSAAGCVDETEIEINVGSYPEAAFDFSPQIGLPPLEVDFTDQSIDAASYQWTFDIGQGAIASDPTHTFLDTGTVIISLTVTNEEGCTDTQTAPIFLTEALTDLCLESIGCIQKGDYIQPVLQVSNFGNFTLDEMQVSMEILDGSSIIENWTGSIEPGEITTIIPASQLLFIEGEQAPFFCVELLPAPGRVESNPSNNSQCKEIVESDISTWESPEPNPATDQLSFRFVNAKDGALSMSIMDVAGREFNTRTYLIGENVIELVTVDVSQLAAGQYYFRLEQGIRVETFPVIILND